MFDVGWKEFMILMNKNSKQHIQKIKSSLGTCPICCPIQNPRSFTSSFPCVGQPEAETAHQDVGWEAASFGHAGCWGVTGVAGLQPFWLVLAALWNDGGPVSLVKPQREGHRSSDRGYVFFLEVCI